MLRLPFRFRRRPLIEELEPRLLYSADLAPVALDAAQPASEIRVVDPQGEFAAQSDSVRTELVVVDTRVENYATLLADIQKQASATRHIDVLVLDPARDGIEQIDDAVARYASLDALHLIAHGESGQVLIGDGWVDPAALDTHAATLEGWRSVLTPDADLLLYGCNVAAGAEGAAFLDTLARLTGADVAASDDVTGSAALGGDWTLEAQRGAIDTPLLLGAQLTVWQGTLDIAQASAQLPVNTETVAAQTTTASSRQVAINPLDDSIVVVWTSQNQDGSNDGVYLQRFDANGAKIGVETRVNTTVAGDQRAPAIAMDASGNFVVVWQSQNVDSNGWGIVAQRFDADGNAVGGEFVVNTTGADNQTAPSVGMDASGNFVVAWVSENQDGDGGGIYARRFNADGSAASGEFRINQTTANDQIEPVVAMNASGAFVVAWTSVDQDWSLLAGFSDGVFARLYDAAGSPVGGEFRVPDVSFLGVITDGDQHTPDVAMNASGDFVVALVDGFDGTIKAYAYDSAGNMQGGGVQVSASGTPTNPAVALDDSGDFVVAWESQTADGDQGGIRARHFHADYTPYQSAQTINAYTPGNQTAPGIALHDGRLVTVWSGQGTPDSLGVYLRIAALANGSNAAPVITSNGGGATATTSVGENTTLVTTVTASDADLPGQTLSYSIVGGADRALFAIDADSGELRFASAPDYEAPADANADNVYEIVVQVSDGALADTQALSVSVAPANEYAPVITSHAGSPVTLSVVENTMAVATFAASDADLPAPSLAWSVSGGADALRFTIDAASGVLAFVAPPDYETPLDANADNVYEVEIQVSDGTLTDTRTLQVSVANANETPAAANGSYGGFEDTPLSDTLPAASDPDGDAVTYSLRGAAGHASVTVNTDGSFSYTPDAEFSGTDSFVFRVTDSNGAFAEYTAYFDIGPVNDAPVLTLQPLQLAEGQTVVLTAAQIQATDVDNTAAQLGFVLTAAPAGGTLNLNGVTLAVNDGFTQADVDAGRISYTATRTGVANLALKVRDPASAEASGTLVVTMTAQPAVTPQPSGGTGIGPAPDAGAPSAPTAPDTVPDAAPDTPPAVATTPAGPAADPVSAPAGVADTALLPDSLVVTRHAATPAVTLPGYGGMSLHIQSPSTQPLLASLDQALNAVAHDLRALESLKLSLGNGNFQDQLDQLRNEIRQLGLDKSTVAASLAISTGLSVGYVLWLVRGGVLLSSLLSSLPAWRLVDPLPVLAHLKRQREGDGDDDSLEGMLKKPAPAPTPAPPDARAHEETA